MEKVKIAVFYGTSEGKEILNFLSNFSCELFGFIATEYALEMDVDKSVNVQMGRLSECEMCDKFQSEKFDFIIDATHPYAVEVSKNIKNACEGTSKYIRVLRDTNVENHVDGVRYFSSVLEVCEYLKEKTGNIFLSTGSKNLCEFAENIGSERLFARVLPSVESLEICESAGIKRKQIFALEGPFSVETNVANLKSVNAKYFVTKQTGNAGGFFQKVEASNIAGATLCVITNENASTQNQSETANLMSVKACKKHFASVLQSKEKAKITIVSMGCGGEKLITPESVEILKNADVVFGTARILKHVETSCEIFPTYKLAEIETILNENPQYRKIVICGTGDVGFHSIASSARKYFAEKYQVESTAGIGSIAYFMSKISKSYKDCVLTSMHGMDGNIAILVSQNKKVFTLLGSAKEMIERLCGYNLANVSVWIGENLSYENEKITFGKASELLGKEFPSLAVAYIENENASGKTDLCDSDFVRGKIPMTKADVRRICVSKLGLLPDSIMYDVGAGTGSVACASAKIMPKGKCFAIECVAEGVELIKKNSENHHLDNVVVVEGMAPKAFENLPAPTHAFIGGSRGNMEEIFQNLLAKNGNIRIIATAVTIETVTELKNVADKFGMNPEITLIQASNAEKLGKYNLMKAENPIYIFTMQK